MTDNPRNDRPATEDDYDTVDFTWLATLGSRIGRRLQRAPERHQEARQQSESQQQPEARPESEIASVPAGPAESKAALSPPDNPGRNRPTPEEDYDTVDFTWLATLGSWIRRRFLRASERQQEAQQPPEAGG